MKTTLATLILLLTISMNSLACECNESGLQELDEKSYEWSDVVVIGDVVKTGTSYQIKVTEILKGNIEGSVINGTITTEDNVYDGCTYFPNDKGTYLFYLKEIQKNGQIFYLYSQCSGTRKLDFGTVFFPLITDKTKSELIAETEKWIDELRTRRK